MRLAAILIAAVLTGSSEDERTMRSFQQWFDAVDQHAAGEEDRLRHPPMVPARQFVMLRQMRHLRRAAEFAGHHDQRVV